MPTTMTSACQRCTRWRRSIVTCCPSTPLGLHLDEAKDLLQKVQAVLIDEQVRTSLTEQMACPDCGRPCLPSEQVRKTSQKYQKEWCCQGAQHLNVLQYAAVIGVVPRHVTSSGTWVKVPVQTRIVVLQVNQQRRFHSRQRPMRIASHWAWDPRSRSPATSGPSQRRSPFTCPPFDCGPVWPAPERMTTRRPSESRYEVPPRHGEDNHTSGLRLSCSTSVPRCVRMQPWRGRA